MHKKNQYLTLKEAAQVSNISRDTIWRAIKNGKLEAVREIGVGGKRFLIEISEIQRWMKERVSDVSEVSDEDQTVQTDSCGGSDILRIVQTDTSDTSDSSDSSKMIPIQAHLEALKTLREAIQSANTSMDKAREAEQIAARYQRQIEALRYELTLHQRTLTEQAESLVEERSLKAESVARVSEAYEKLKADNEEQKQQWLIERDQLVEKLKTSEKRVSWMEQRVPLWVRALFRAG